MSTFSSASVKDDKSYRKETLRKNYFRFATTAAVVAALMSATSCATPPATNARPAAECRQLDAQLPWPGEVREQLQKTIDAHSSCTGTARGDKAPVAIFDWDNTVVKNDIGYGTNFWMLRNDKVLQPANKDWKSTNRYLTDAAAKALAVACGTDTPAGQPLKTSSNTECADEILAILEDKTRSGEPAFEGFNARHLIGAYAWGTALSAGYTEEQLGGFALAMKQENLLAPEGSMQTVGSQQVDGYIRIYPQMKDLIGVLQAHGIETWAVSASPEPVVKAWAGEVGIDAGHVVGVRSVYEDGIQTSHLKGCGGIPDGEDSVMTYIEGKRCWANQVIFGVEGPSAFEQLPAERRQILAAGDSGTDVTFVADATEARLVVNRNNAEIMCRAYDNEDGKWLITPMFIDPKPQRSEPYPCSTKGYTNPDSSKGPVLREDGSLIPDQTDRVH
ncbi:haloacid dehalogenase-like hydrolase [Arthrobacter sp. StoSoilB13]|uniref:HAD family hydrolase n=1 Tax=Arthrobacter sp. StoSoilB13 TaxID=2830993 RepID=UPI001CC5AEF5|nr:haloacid dehalogenase-like hydrolase [Arthrobacter sp. StoSoilB13]BCW48536.1 putative conserved lipoprotein LppF [Arthrobacter sp. StoSoilB13]